MGNEPLLHFSSAWGLAPRSESYSPPSPARKRGIKLREPSRMESTQPRRKRSESQRQRGKRLIMPGTCWWTRQIEGNEPTEKPSGHSDMAPDIKTVASVTRRQEAQLHFLRGNLQVEEIWRKRKRTKRKAF